MQYKIVKAETAGNLETKVIDGMRRGWYPQGGVARGVDGLGYVYYQAMARETIAAGQEDKALHDFTDYVERQRIRNGR